MQENLFEGVMSTFRRARSECQMTREEVADAASELCEEAFGTDAVRYLESRMTGLPSRAERVQAICTVLELDWLKMRDEILQAGGWGS